MDKVPLSASGQGCLWAMSWIHINAQSRIRGHAAARGIHIDSAVKDLLLLHPIHPHDSINNIIT